MRRIHLHLVELPRDVLHKAEQRLSDIIADVNLIAEAPGFNVHHWDARVDQPKVKVDDVDDLKGVAHHVIDASVVPRLKLVCLKATL